MRLLYAGNADNWHRSPQKVSIGERRRNPRGTVRQSLSLHRLSEHRRRDPCSGAFTRWGRLMKLQFLSAGRLRLKKSIYIKTADRSETFEAPVSSALIRHRQGNVLFDTGCHPSVVEHGEERWGSLMKVMTPLMRAEDTLLPNLACVRLNPDDIDVVVNSHFHPDHCGCNQFFKNATIMVHAREIEAASAPAA